MILTIKTDKPEAEVGLFFDTGQERQYRKWLAHRQLAESIHKEIDALLKAEQISWNQLTAIICYGGPGSFTGLRIGISVANALAYSLGVPIAGASGGDWIIEGFKKINSAKADQLIKPNYGKSPHITTPKH